MPQFICPACNRTANFIHIHLAMKLAGVSRSTIYYWMEHGWIHWRETPSRRRLICQESLDHSGKGPRSPDLSRLGLAQND